MIVPPNDQIVKKRVFWLNSVLEGYRKSTFLRILTPTLSIPFVAELRQISKLLSFADFEPAVPPLNDVIMAKKLPLESVFKIPSQINPNVFDFKSVEKKKHPVIYVILFCLFPVCYA